jgi:hypothetical protein
MSLTRHEVTLLANTLLSASGLTAMGWKFRINTNRSRLGVCRYRERSIEVSQYHLTSPVSEIRNTLLHEIAHALVGPGHGHGYVWKRKAIEIGCTGERCGKMEAPSKYKGTCRKCAYDGFKANRMTERMRYGTHRNCGGTVEWTAIAMHSYHRD